MDVALEKKLSGYKQIALEKLQNIFLTIPGMKDLVVEPQLVKILDSFANMTWLKQKGFDRIFKLSPAAPPKKTGLVYMITSNLQIFKTVCDQITQLSNKSPCSEMGIKDFHVIVIPNLFATFKNLLETEGLDGIVELHRFSWDFIKIDRNLLSLELPQVYSDVFVKQDTSLLCSIASSLRIHHMIHGRPNLIISYGENSNKIISMISTMENFSRTSAKEICDYPDFSSMIVIDRSKDFTSCLLTPVTYSGLMVELFETRAGVLTIDPVNNKMNNGKLKILSDKKENLADEYETKTLRMCGTTDELYTSNKYRHFSEVVNIIKAESKKLEEEHRKYSRDMTIEQMKGFVEQNLPKVAVRKKVLYKHLLICEKIVQEMSGNFEKQQNIEENILRNGNRKQILTFIEEQLYTNGHQWNILRLMCLVHICVGGLTADEINKFIAGYLNTFGHKYLHVFQNLSRASLFPEITRTASKNLIGITQLPKKTQFQIESAKLKLIPNEETTNAEGRSAGMKACASYVFNGNYTPLVSQLANVLLTSESSGEFAGRIAHLQNIKIAGSSFGDDLESVQDSLLQKNNVFPIKRTLFIFIVGGITYAEIAACNLIESLTGSTIVLASDRVINGIDIMKASC